MRTLHQSFYALKHHGSKLVWSKIILEAVYDDDDEDESDLPKTVNGYY